MTQEHEFQNLQIEVQCKRAYKGIYVDLRSTEASRAISQKRDIVFTCDQFPNQKITLKYTKIEDKKVFENKDLLHGHYGQKYTLKAYKFIPD